MGSALRLHPLLVIFGLLAGGEIYGLPGVLVALPMLAAGRAIWEFFASGSSSSRGRTAARRSRSRSSRGAAERPRAADRCACQAYAVSAFPATRLRRLRRTGPLRDLVRETRLDLDDFVHAALRRAGDAPNEGLPAMARYTVDDLVREVDELASLGVDAVILFGIPEEKDDEGSGAWDEDGIVQRALRELRPRFPELLLLTDVCLCEYTSHGHCGVIRDGEVENDDVARADRAHGRLARRGRRRRRLPERHDGRPRRRDPRAAPRDADRRVLGEVRLRVLRPVPRGGGVGAVIRRPPRLPDGSRRTSARRCASASSTSPRARTC